MANLSVHLLKYVCAQSLKRQFKCLFTPHIVANRNFSLSSTAFNNIRKYGDKHEWISVEGSVGTVGISHYAQESLGEVVFVQLPEVFTKCKINDDVGVIESVKAVNELSTPVSGTIIEINTKLEENPGLVNQSCYDEGWIFKIDVLDPKELDDLMNEQEYQVYLNSTE